MLSRTLARRLFRQSLRSSPSSNIISRRTFNNVSSMFSSSVGTRLLIRAMSTPAPQLNVSELSAENYHKLSDATMATLLERLEDLLDETGNDAYEVDYHSGVLTLILGNNGTYVINKQPPNKQIWLSSPLSGPKRYDYFPESDDWRYSRDGRSLEDLLHDELGNVFEKKLNLGLENVSTQVE